MEQTTEFPDRSGLGKRLIWGRRHAVALRAVAFAVALFLVVAGFRYAEMAAFADIAHFGGWTHSVLWEGVLEALEHPALITGLAAIYVYLNGGILPAFLLAAAPVLGIHIWIFEGPYGGSYVLVIEPIAGYWEWLPAVIRSVTPYAILGFFVGIAANWLRTGVLDLPEPI